MSNQGLELLDRVNAVLQVLGTDYVKKIKEAPKPAWNLGLTNAQLAINAEQADYSKACGDLDLAWMNFTQSTETTRLTREAYFRLFHAYMGIPDLLEDLEIATQSLADMGEILTCFEEPSEKVIRREEIFKRLAKTSENSETTMERREILQRLMNRLYVLKCVRKTQDTADYTLRSQKEELISDFVSYDKAYPVSTLLTEEYARAMLYLQQSTTMELRDIAKLERFVKKLGDLESRTENGPGEEDEPWAEGWNQRSGLRKLWSRMPDMYSMLVATMTSEESDKDWGLGDR